MVELRWAPQIEMDWASDVPTILADDGQSWKLQYRIQDGALLEDINTGERRQEWGEWQDVRVSDE